MKPTEARTMSRCLSLVLTVDVLEGTSDERAAVELQMLATDMGTIVEAKMRDIVMRAYPGRDWQGVLAEFIRDEKLSQYPKS